jgi:hypothetical protein
MSRKNYLPLRVAPLQRVIAEPITDAAEQAAIDKLRKRKKRNEGARHAARRKPK